MVSTFAGAHFDFTGYMPMFDDAFDSLLSCAQVNYLFLTFHLTVLTLISAIFSVRFNQIITFNLYYSMVFTTPFWFRGLFQV